jgi:phosphoribosylaminoimidazolecarboxamide formyltransferase/IMP cyclohydrolase
MGRVKTALISVSDKGGLAEFAGALARMGVKIVASGGTRTHLAGCGVEAVETSVLTGTREFLGGLVKTLHPAIHAGILARREDPAHMRELAALGYEKIDMVVVDFYPLGEAKRGRDLSFIDIGGPAMARAAAKNFASCVPVTHPSWYEPVLRALADGGDIDAGMRWDLARDAIRRTGMYDASVLSLTSASSDADRVPATVLLGLTRRLELRYGENPHQAAGFFTPGGAPGFDVIKGEVSYNNILDIDCSTALLDEFTKRAAVVIKHAGPCGVAEGADGPEALRRAYACDPLSAFGGVVGLNFPFSAACAGFLAGKFVECIIAPAFDEDALASLSKKKRTRLVAVRGRPGGVYSMRTALGGMLIQTGDDTLLAADLDFVTGRPGDEMTEDLIFAWKAVKHARSNAVVFARSGATIGIGAGQPSRVDSTKTAIRKAREGGHDLEGSVMASDGFFPFPDSIELAAEVGARAVIQPGGSIRDKEVIERAKELGIAMALTHTRHFRH